MGVQRTVYFDVLRVIAIAAVVVLHTAAQPWYLADPHTGDWQALNLFDSLTRFCVPVFFMISGALFLDPARNITMGSILRKSLPRLAIAFVVWSVFYGLVNTFVFRTTSGIAAFIGQVMVGHYHLWFLWALMGLYLLTPLLRRICEDRSLAVYFVVLAFVFGSVLPLLAHLPAIGVGIAGILDAAQVKLVLGFTMYFVLGYLLNTGAADSIRTRWVLVAGIAAVATTAGGTAFLSMRSGHPDGLLYGYSTPNVVIASAAVFLLTARLVGTRRKVGWLTWFIGSCSFGIYLVHPLFQAVLISQGITTRFMPAVISVPLITLVIFVPSLFVAAVLHRIPRVGRYLA